MDSRAPTSRLPKSISPCPIVEAVAEIRFEPVVPRDAVFGMFYSKIRGRFPRHSSLPVMNIPGELRNTDPQFAFSAHYTVEDEEIAVKIGPQVVNVGAKGEYRGWEVMQESFVGIHGSLLVSDVMGKVVRYGLRYISFFEGDIFPKLKLSVALDGRGLSGAETQFSTVLAKGACLCRLNIKKDVKVAAKADTVGSIIDIDCSLNASSSKESIDFQRFLKDAHSIEKALFFGLLNVEFLESLNPIYDDNV